MNSRRLLRKIMIEPKSAEIIENALLFLKGLVLGIKVKTPTVSDRSRVVTD
jgi:hypothetical protein